MWKLLAGEMRHRFGVLALTANPHAEGKNSVLQQGQSLVQGRIIAALQELNRLFDLGTHPVQCSTSEACPFVTSGLPSYHTETCRVSRKCPISNRYIIK